MGYFVVCGGFCMLMVCQVSARFVGILLSVAVNSVQRHLGTGFCTFLAVNLTPRVLLAATCDTRDTLFGAVDEERTEDSLTYLIPSATAFALRNSSSRCNFCHFTPLKFLRWLCRFSICSRSQADTLRTGTHFRSYFFFRGPSKCMVLMVHLEFG